MMSCSVDKSDTLPWNPLQASVRTHRTEHNGHTELKLFQLVRWDRSYSFLNWDCWLAAHRSLPGHLEFDQSTGSMVHLENVSEALSCHSDHWLVDVDAVAGVGWFELVAELVVSGWYDSWLGCLKLILKEWSWDDACLEKVECSDLSNVYSWVNLNETARFVLIDDLYLSQMNDVIL